MTKRLILRPLTAKDYPKWKKAHDLMLPPQNEWDIAKRQKIKTNQNEFVKLITDYNKKLKSDEFYYLSVFDKKTKDIIGVVSAMNVSRSIAQSAYLGYFIYNNYWKMGYGKESVNGMIHHCFKNLKLHRIEAGIDPRNKRSIFLARSLNLRKEGLKKRAVFLNNSWSDLTIYSATCDEFGYKWKW